MGFDKILREFLDATLADEFLLQVDDINMSRTSTTNASLFGLDRQQVRRLNIL